MSIMISELLLRVLLIQVIFIPLILSFSFNKNPFGPVHLVKRYSTSLSGSNTILSSREEKYSDLAETTVTFDVTDTLIQLREEVGHYYREAIMKEICDIGIEHMKVPTANKFTQGFIMAYKSQMQKEPNYGSHSNNMAGDNKKSSRDWWKQVVYQSFQNTFTGDDIHFLLDGTSKDRTHDEKKVSVNINDDKGGLFDELFSLFETQNVWEVKPGASELLQTLSKKHMTIGVLSNFDERLHKLLDNLELSKYFDFILTSQEIGYAKPDPKTFEYIMKRQKSDGTNMVHVGNSLKADVVGAINSGWSVIYIPSNSDTVIEKEESILIQNDVLSKIKESKKSEKEQFVIDNDILSKLLIVNNLSDVLASLKSINSSKLV